MQDKLNKDLYDLISALAGTSDFTSAENAENRRVALMQENLNADAVRDSAFSTALGSFAGAIVNGIFT